MKMFLMEIISGDGETTTIHGHTPYSNLAHKWAKDFTHGGGSRVIGITTTYTNRTVGKAARITEVKEYIHEIKS